VLARFPASDAGDFQQLVSRQRRGPFDRMFWNRILTLASQEFVGTSCLLEQYQDHLEGVLCKSALKKNNQLTMAIEISFPMFASLNQFLWHFPAEIHDHFQSLRCFVFIVFIRRTIQDNSTRQQLKDLLSASSRIADCYNAPKAPYINGTAPFASQNNFRCPEKFRLNQTEPWIGNKVRSMSNFSNVNTYPFPDLRF